MKCTECGHKLSIKHYDAAYEWYECPSCEGCFTYDEILEGGTDESDEPEEAEGQGDRSRSQGAKAGRGRGKKRKDATRAHKGVQKASRNRKVSGRNGASSSDGRKAGVVAKGKKRRTQIEDDDQAITEYEKKILEPTVKQKEKRHRDELDAAQVLGIWQDEIQDIYHDLGSEIDEVNARDKALIIWRDLHIQGGVTAREQAVPHALCKEHA